MVEIMNSDKIGIDEIINEDNERTRNSKYNKYVKNVTPTHKLCTNVYRAFLVGGIICTIGEVFVKMYTFMGASEENAKLYNIITLVFLSALFTGLGCYSRWATYAGAGTLVPITGFANAIASAAIEFKKEGQVFGIGCRLFTIAGPVILYGIFSSWILGIVYLIFK